MKSIITKLIKRKKEREAALKTIQEIHVAMQQLAAEIEELKRMVALVGSDTSWSLIDDYAKRPGKVKEIIDHALQHPETERRIRLDTLRLFRGEDARFWPSGARRITDDED